MLIRDNESMSADIPAAPQGVIKCNGSTVTICPNGAGLDSARKVSVKIKALSLVLKSDNLLVVCDFVLHHGTIGSFWTLPGQGDAVPAPPLLNNHTH